jgi:hypothetical protein
MREDNIMTDLKTYLESSNAKSQARMDAEPGLWCSMWTTDLAYWAECDVYTVNDFERHQLISGISDASKDLYGCRLRLDWASMSTEQLREEYEVICNSLNYEFELEQERLEEERVGTQGLKLDCEPLPYEEYADLEEYA